ncbi:hypothetical protein CAEBREN_13839 [Caenorhabditis brenneri]|uniref:Uncharacterized protein n=1 Tax=Caenorhabditis brenneri TaxID=135651 RepID=G0NX50_CAEBE|nr:hypothetical protein CAEBREN_13839 [Caenorhabditis brenneri]
MRFFYQVIPHNELHNPNNWEELENFYLEPITRAGFEQEVQEVFGCRKQVVIVYDLFYLHQIDLQQLGHRHFLLYEADQYLIASSIPHDADGLNVAVRAIFRELEFPPED